jgi:hypothetical protein
MKVKIIKANRPTYWYNSEIGEIFDVVKIGDRYEVDDGYGSYIDLDDALEIKTVTAKFDLSWIKGEAREVISREIQKKLFEIGAAWRNAYDNPSDAPYLFCVDNAIMYHIDKDVFDAKVDSRTKTKEQLAVIPEVSVNNALKGKFWTYSSVSKKEEAPKPDGYKVDLSMYKGKAREAISKAVQEEAFKKGFSWHLGEKSIKHLESVSLYFWMSDHDICYDESEDGAYFNAHKFKELSVEEILSGALPQVK